MAVSGMRVRFRIRMRDGYYSASVHPCHPIHYVARKRCGRHGSRLLTLTYCIDML
jgi:hypothetical protein